MDQLTYQQILAQTYEENAKDTLVFQQHEHDDEDVESYTDEEYVEKYDDMDLADKEKFNRFQPRHESSDVIKPEQRETPSELKRNTNIRNLVLNIDGQFRGNIVPGETFQCTGSVNTGTKTTGTSSSEFSFMGSRLYKNVTSIKMTSCEFHNTFYTFSKERGNTSFTVLDLATNITYVVSLGVKDGANYATPQLFEAAVNAAITAAGVPGLQLVYNANEHLFSFISLLCTITFPTTNNNPNGNGIGYNLGFLQKSYTTSGILADITAEGAPDILQDRYVYLDINQWNVVEHQQYGQTFFPVFAKLQLSQPKNSTTFVGNYVDSSTKEYYFQQPINVQKFDIRILDAYGNVINMRNANISITLEVRESYDFPTYERVRALM